MYFRKMDNWFKIGIMLLVFNVILVVFIVLNFYLSDKKNLWFTMLRQHSVCLQHTTLTDTSVIFIKNVTEWKTMEKESRRQAKIYQYRLHEFHTITRTRIFPRLRLLIVVFLYCPKKGARANAKRIYSCTTL